MTAKRISSEQSIIDIKNISLSQETSDKTEIDYRIETRDEERGDEIESPNNIINEGGDIISVDDGTNVLDCGGPPPQKEKERNHCPICLESYNDAELVIASKYCSHTFHKSCILAWLEQHDGCPCCREPMITDEDVKSTVNSVDVSHQPFCHDVNLYGLSFLDVHMR